MRALQQKAQPAGGGAQVVTMPARGAHAPEHGNSMREEKVS